MEIALRVRLIVSVIGLCVLVLTIIFLLSAVVPFYANGIHLHSYADITSSLVDVKGYPPFTWFGPIQAISMLSAGYVRPLSIVLTSILVMALVVSWRALLGKERGFWTSVAVVNAVIVAVLWQATTVIEIWLVD